VVVGFARRAVIDRLTLFELILRSGSARSPAPAFAGSFERAWAAGRWACGLLRHQNGACERKRAAQIEKMLFHALFQLFHALFQMLSFLVTICVSQAHSSLP
jgi:hypothetical protein